MSSSTSKLPLLVVNQSLKEVAANNMFDAASNAMLFARDDTACGGLTWGYLGDNKLINGVPTSIPNGTKTATANLTNYLYEENGVVTITTVMPTGWPGPLDGNKVALYEMVAGASTITSYTDWRVSGGGQNRVGARVGTLVFASTMTLDWSKYDVLRVTLTNNCTFAHTGGLDGDQKTLEITQDATGSRTALWGAEAAFSVTTPSPTFTTTANKMDKLRWQKRGTKYDLTSITKGF